MKKQQQSILAKKQTFYYVGAIVLIIAIVAFSEVYEKDVYDEDEDKCLDIEESNGGFFDLEIMEKLGGRANFIKNYNEKYETQLHECWPYISDNIEMGLECDFCRDWREKTLCEKDPENEDCACDLYDNDTIRIWVDTNISMPEFYKSLNESIEQGNFSYVQNNDTLEFFIDNEAGVYLVYNYEIINGSCIKAHEANECEKGDDDYIWDYKETDEWNCTGDLADCQYMCYGTDCTLIKEKYCRKKNKCDKDPNSEGCICDEWKKETYSVKHTVWNFTCYARENTAIQVGFQADVTPYSVVPVPTSNDYWICEQEVDHFYTENSTYDSFFFCAKAHINESYINPYWGTGVVNP